jgi:ABC-type uncharacterized transport system auxiliary subunit
MKYSPGFPAILIGLSIVLTGCLTASTIAAARYYTITPAPAIETLESSGKPLGVRPLIGAKPYKLAIAYTAADNRLAYYQNAEWADLPATMLNRALMDGLIKLGAFSEVDDAANMKRPSFILTGELRRFEADYNRETPAAVVEMIAIVRDVETGTSLWQGYVTGETPLPVAEADANLHSDASLAAVAEAMTQSVSSVVEQACAKIGAAL